MNPLYQISNNYLSLYHCMDECSDEKEFIDKIQSLEEDFDTKSMNIVSLIKNLKIDVGNLDQVESELRNKKKNISKKIDSLTEYLKFNMEKIGKSEIKNSIHCAKISLNPPSVKINEGVNISDEYLIHQEIIKVDLNKIKNDIRMGVVIDGVELEQKNRLVIK